MLAPSLPKHAGGNASLPDAVSPDAVSPDALLTKATKPPLREARLDSLTSLRFMAAAMIVVSHSVGKFNLDPHQTIQNLPLAQGVSFFFVLSGFILTYVYQDLKGLKPFMQFLAARVARVWPVFFCAACITYAILPGTMIAKTPIGIAQTVVSQILMLHGWIPARFFYFSLNSPSWSISTEFFFYLAFPLLILNLRETWLAKLTVIAALPIVLIFLSQALNLPALGGEQQISSHGLLYISPLSRIFEFYLGMLTCLQVAKLKTRRMSRTAVTILEVAALLLIGILLCNIEPWMFRCGLTTNFPQLQLYLKYCGNALGYVLLIAMIGLEQGYIAQFLKLPVLVFLGEVSYSVYLLHYPLIAFYSNNALLFLTMPRILRYGLFWAALLFISTASFLFLEKPSRKALRRLFSSWMEKTTGNTV